MSALKNKKKENRMTDKLKEALNREAMFYFEKAFEYKGTYAGVIFTETAQACMDLAAETPESKKPKSPRYSSASSKNIQGMSSWEGNRKYHPRLQ